MHAPVDRSSDVEQDSTAAATPSKAAAMTATVVRHSRVAVHALVHVG